jgi:UDP-N-acetylglucosamine--N-acetylmuramyl-(pentapeptide) pyrophosphoryl-undecaprenol N-acetylglucosamine transferase
MASRIVIAGGGTAGHVIPGLALARILEARGHDVSFVGTAHGIEARLIPGAGFEFHAVPARPFVRKVSWGALSAPFIALRAVAAARTLVRDSGAVIGMGGYVSVPAVLAARREKVPAVLHEQNAIPGLANRLLARLARAVGLSFGEARRSFPRRVRVEITGNPVRSEILRVVEERDALAKEAREVLELEEERRTVLIFGGSQGALNIDRASVGACRLLSGRADLQIVLITGPAHVETIARALPSDSGKKGLLVRALGYLDRMELAYACADLVVCRSGATTIAEVTACGLPSLQVPYPYATRGHQEANARALQRAGAGAVLLDEQLSSESLVTRIEALIDHRERLEAMAERSRAYGRPDAGDRLADLVEEASRM